MNAIFFSACAVLVVVPMTFVCHDVYQDGVFGRAGLLGIAFSAATFLLEAAFGESEYQIMPQTVMLTSSFAVFLCWHLWRFHRRVLKQQ